MKNILIILCFISISTFADTFKTDDQFSITLPEGWIEIPTGTLDEYCEALAELAPNIQQTYDYGFQHTSQDNWFSPPYILIQVKNIGRVPSGKLSQFKKFDKASENVTEKIKESFSDQISDVALNEPTYDSQNNILWVFSSIGLREGETVKCISAMKLTEKGAIQLMGYSTEDSYETYKDFYRETFINLGVEESIRYKPQVTDSIPILNGINWDEVMLAGIKGAIIAGIISVFTIFSKKKKTKKKQEQKEPTPDQF